VVCFRFLKGAKPSVAKPSAISRSVEVVAATTEGHTTSQERTSHARIGDAQHARLGIKKKKKRAASMVPDRPQAAAFSKGRYRRCCSCVVIEGGRAPVSKLRRCASWAKAIASRNGFRASGSCPSQRQAWRTRNRNRNRSPR